jgi:hypothetical protein
MQAMANNACPFADSSICFLHSGQQLDMAHTKSGERKDCADKAEAQQSSILEQSRAEQIQAWNCHCVCNLLCSQALNTFATRQIRRLAAFDTVDTRQVPKVITAF